MDVGKSRGRPPAFAISHDFRSNCRTRTPDKPMTSRKQTLLILILFSSFVWLLISVLGPLATKGWMGPVPARNLEDGFNAGALFYTEVNLEELRSPDTATPDHPLRNTR